MSANFPFSLVSTTKQSDNETLQLLHSDVEDNEEKGKSHCVICNQTYFWVWTLVLLTLFISIVYALNPSKDSDNYPISLLSTGDRIQLRSIHSNLFVRVSDATGSLLLDQPIPWKRGSSFEVEAAGECFLLRSLTGKYVRVDSTGAIHSSSQNRYGATHFTAVTKYDSTTTSINMDGDFSSKVSMQVHLKMCNKNRWFQEVSQLSSSITEDNDEDGVTSGTEGDISSQSYGTSKEKKNSSLPKSSYLKSTNMIVTAPVDTTAMSWGAPTIAKTMSASSLLTTAKKYLMSRAVGSNEKRERHAENLRTDQGGLKSTRPLLSAFDVISVPQIRGVNLGGWFIPEVWMAQDFFNGTGLGWGGSLCTMVNYSRSLAEERMAERLATWITIEDLREIKIMGFNSVRLPIGYWNLMADPYRKYAPLNHRTSLKYIDWCFDTCEKLGLTVLLDLHGAPGSQNGIDHSGCSMEPTWLYPSNIALTLQAIEVMAARYSGRKNLAGFELLNEPAEMYGVNNHTQLNDFYVKSYHMIRKYSLTAMVVFNELYSKQYASWNKEMREPNYYNVIVDWHLYQFQFPKYSTNEHVAAARAWELTIEEYEPIHPIIVGEWSMGTGAIKQAGQPYVDAAVRSLERSSGWYLWNWKVQPGIGFDEWDVQAQHAMKNGLDPLKAVRELENENMNILIKDDRRSRKWDGMTSARSGGAN